MRTGYSFKNLAALVKVAFILMRISLILKTRGIEHALDVSQNSYFCYQSNCLKTNIKQIGAVSKLLPFSSCLARGLALKIISSKSLNLSIVIGVKRNSIFESHAWVEQNNKIIFGETKNQNEYKKIYGT